MQAKRLHILTLVLLFVAFFALPTNASAVTLDNLQYTPGENVQVMCAHRDFLLQLYDITSGVDGLIANGGNLGEYACDPGTVSFDSQDGHTYALLEVSNSLCMDMDYSDCVSNGPLSGEAPEVHFDIGDSDILVVPQSGSGGGGSSAPLFGPDKNIYLPGENVQVMCAHRDFLLQLYDITSGVDGLIANGGNLGEYACDPGTVSFDSQDGHTYALLEVSNSLCMDMDYSDCVSNGPLSGVGPASWQFNVQAPDNLTGNILPPSLHLFSPKARDVFSKSATISYTTANSTQVYLYYSTTLADWEGEAIADTDRTPVSLKLPLEGPYVWDTSKLASGAWYRVIVDAIGKGGVAAEQVSGLFTIDQDAPTFSVSVNPPATRGEDVTISVDSVKELKVPPIVTVTQAGGTAVAVVMSVASSTDSTASSTIAIGNTHFEGTYKVVPGHDGAATISVTGVSLAGNQGGTIVSGGTFAVGVNPPPKPHVSSPLPNSVLGTSTITVTGTTRPDTTVVVKVNGTSVYKATPNKDGTFSVPNIALRAEGGGKNTLDVEAVDITNIPSEAVPVTVRYNIAPLVTISNPSATTTSAIGGAVAFSALASDANNDPLTFTYQIINEKDFVSTDVATASTSSQAAWITVAEQVASSHYTFDTTQFDDGLYRLRIIADDGAVQVVSEPVRVTIRNTLPFFKFEDGRKTISKSLPVSIVGHALEPTTVSPQPAITKVEYSTDNGKKWKPVTIDSAGRFAVSFSGSTSTPEDNYNLLWRVTDSRKLVGRATHTVTIDQTPPASPVIGSPRKGAVITKDADEDAIADGVQITLSGNAEPLSTVTFGTGVSARSTKAGIDGSFAFHGVLVTTGSNAYTLSATDLAGNVSPTASYIYVYDNPPEISFTSPKPNRAFATKGAVAWKLRDIDNDRIVGVTLSYRRAGEAFTQLPIKDTDTSYAWDVHSLPQGSDYELRLQAGDGLATSSEVIGFAIDRTSPTLSSVTFAKTVLGKSATLEAKGSANDTLSGIEYIEYAIVPVGQEPTDVDWYAALVTSGFLQKQATFTLTQPTQLLDDSYHAYVRAVDAAGNVSAATVKDITVDSTPPRVGSFEAKENAVALAPDTSGALSLYTNNPVLFGISLEADTAKASLTLCRHRVPTSTDVCGHPVPTDAEEVPLVRDIVSGLWQASITIARDMPILLNATDELGNSYTNKQIGTFTTIEPGMISESGTPVVGAKIRVLSKNEQGDFVATSADTTVDTNGTYHLALGAGEYELVAYAPGYATVMHPLTLEHSSIISTPFATQSIGIVRQFIQSITDHFAYGL